MRWILAYDVSSCRRRARLARLLERRATRVQKSVFEAHLSEAALAALFDDLRQLLGRGDRLTAYPQCLACASRDRTSSPRRPAPIIEIA